MKCVNILESPETCRNSRRVQVINTLLEYHTRGMSAATFSSRTKVTEQEWGHDEVASETTVHFRRGYLCHGTIDKAQYGTGGLLHAVQVCACLLAATAAAKTANLGQSRHLYATATPVSPAPTGHSSA